MFKIQPDKKQEAETKVVKNVGMIAGGTGITPMLQLVRQVFKDPEDKTNLWMIFANQVKQMFVCVCVCVCVCCQERDRDGGIWEVEVGGGVIC